MTETSRSGRRLRTFKRIYEIDITGATDISTLGATSIPGGKTLEQATVAELTTAGIVPVSKTLRLDLVAAGFAHDKAEGMALGPGNMLFVSSLSARRDHCSARGSSEIPHTPCARTSVRGFGRGSGRDRDRSLTIARGESEETIGHLGTNFRAQRIGGKDYWPLRNQYVVIGKMLNGIMYG